MLRIIFVTLLAVALTSPVYGEDLRNINIHGVEISLPVPSGYQDVSEENELPINAALFETEAVEPWEEIGELSEGILFYGISFKPTDEAIKQTKFEQIVGFVKDRLAGEIDGKSFVMPKALVTPTLIDSIYRNINSKNASSIEVSDDRPDRKALLIETAVVLPGIITYPILEEISFVRMQDKIIIFHAFRMDAGKLSKEPSMKDEIRVQLKVTGLSVRDGIVN